MTTSGVITSTMTARDVVTDALLELQVYAANQTVNAADGALGMRRLNYMLKDWQNDGVNLWRVTEGTVDFAASQASVELTTRMVDISEARLVQTGYERSLQRTEWAEFASYPNKDQEGTPVLFIPSATVGAYSIRLWPVPSEAVTINYSGARVIEDVSDLNETLDVPQQYLRTVTMCLAANLANAFGKAGEAGFVIEEAKRLYRIMRAADRPASYFLTSAGARYG